MEKVVFDTSIVLDAAMNRKGSADSLRLVQAVINEEIVGMVTSNTITDIHNIVKKRCGESADYIATGDQAFLAAPVPVQPLPPSDLLQIPEALPAAR